MLKSLILSVVFLGLASLSQAQTPDASTIEQAMSQGMELEFSHFQEIADVILLQGGITLKGDFLFLCTGRLSWKLSSDELT